MSPEIFFRIFANLPISERLGRIPDEHDPMGINLIEVNRRIEAIQEKIRPDIIRRDELLKKASSYFVKNDLI